MKPNFILVLFLTLNLTILPFHGAANHSSFTTCSTSDSCGILHNITYPFWGLGRPGFCGRPEFQLLCPTGSKYPSILFGTTAYMILNIDSNNQTITLAGQEFVFTNTTCPPVLLNNTLNDTLFTFHDQNDVVNLTLLYQCPQGAQSSNNNKIIDKFNCSNGNLSSAVAYYDNDDLSVGDSSKLGCGIGIGVPVFVEALERLMNGTETLLGVLSEGFKVGYKMNVSACNACEDSGGACGSSLDSSDEFVCYCPHGHAAGFRCHAGKSDKRKIVIGVVIGILGSAIIISALYLLYIRRCKKYHSSTNSTMHQSRNIPSIFNPYTFSNLENGENYHGVNLFTYHELEEATKRFSPSKELGDGGFGTVYHGKLRDGREVAIKRLYENNSKRVEQFMNEIEILARLHHKNLVALYGCTSHHSRELLLVYEYVPNGTVADHLHGHTSSLEKPDSKFSHLPWCTRLSIAIETASALVYLHASDVIHRDVKTNNILLDDNFSVKVADFGLSRLFPMDATHVSTAPQGTPGYVDPEYHQCYHLTDKSDVYSFGVVLVELISSKHAVDITRRRCEINLSSLAVNKIQNNSIHELIDPSLGFEFDSKVKEEVIGVAELAFQCLQHNREMRPTMEKVLEVLTRIQETRDQSIDDDKIKKSDDKNIGLVQGDVVEIPMDEAFRLKSDLSSVSSPGSKEKSVSSSTSTSQASC